MEMPEITKVAGMFPLKYGTFLISLFGLASGGVGVAGIVLFALVEKSILVHFSGYQNVDPTLKKVMLATIGLTSLLLLVANTLLFLGVVSSSGSYVGTSKIILFCLCFMLLLGCIGAPVSCFFVAETCIIKKLSMVSTLLGYFVMLVFIEVWLYFTVVAYNYQQLL